MSPIPDRHATKYSKISRRLSLIYNPDYAFSVLNLRYLRLDLRESAGNVFAFRKLEDKISNWQPFQKNFSYE